MLLKNDGTVKSAQKISNIAGVDDNDNFGLSVAALGDLDNDGIGDLAVGAYKDDDGGTDRGAVWILFLNNYGAVKSFHKISDTEDDFLEDGDWFGFSVGAMGDLDGDSVCDLAVEAVLDDDAGSDRGAVWILFLNNDGTVKLSQKISDTEGGFGGVLDNADYFGVSVAAVGDLDKNGAVDLAVGAHTDDDGGANRGAVWVLFLNKNGTVRWFQKISDITTVRLFDLENVVTVWITSGYKKKWL